jgi:predicted transcriptional regulator
MAMARLPYDVTETELAILEILWNHGSATRRLVTDALYPDGGPAQYATVQKLLERLEAKGFVRHERHQGILSFMAIVSREDLVSRGLERMADKLCGGSLTSLLLNLVRSKPLAPEEVEELKALLDELRGHSKRNSS